MINFLNSSGDVWLPFFLTFQIQNTLFILLVLAILYVFGNTRALFKKQITLIALIKTLIPPVISLPFIGTVVRLDTIPLIKADFLIDVIGGGIAAENGLQISGFFFLIWLSGALLILSLFVYSSIKLRADNRKAERFYPTKMSLPARIKVYKNSKIKSPLVYGCVSPKIVLPLNWESFDKRMQHSILIHELCHIKNGDLWFNGIKLLSTIIHFINPLHWVLLHYFEMYSEMACDDSAIEKCALNREEYNRLIVQSAEALALPYWISRSHSLSRAFKLLKRRISYQINQKEDCLMKHSPLFRSAVLVVLLLSVIPLSWQCSKTDQSPERATSLEPVPVEKPAMVDENGVYAFFAVDKKPAIKEKIQPEYPDEARRKGIEGLVLLVVTIDENGQVIKAVPLEEVPVRDDKGRIVEMRAVDRLPELEPAAIAAAEKCTFKPAMKDGKAVKVKMAVPFRFRLH
ncbi:MAG TPA: M56 family peptidase [Caldithrix abyssi]|uniref:M56 family peptidase n=1 Tax=Caldithrix abyssi TaxID=187145 RepID=A0A7V4TYE1_CALAY|nr:M56 family peptidase [Caldithrix abyssi]